MYHVPGGSSEGSDRSRLVTGWIPHCHLQSGQHMQGLGPEEEKHRVHHPRPHQPGLQCQVSVVDIVYII